MEPYEQDRVGRCDFLDVLEEAATFGGRVRVRHRDGHTFEDVVRDVVTIDGADYVVFAGNGRLRVADLASATRSGPPRA